ncbi:MAG: hypothetical protein KDB69_09390 [Acidimicrobiia bacterium]|nr:hypothetical protein [Acidimicrobiia bacterium]
MNTDPTKNLPARTIVAFGMLFVLGALTTKADTGGRILLAAALVVVTGSLLLVAFAIRTTRSARRDLERATTAMRAIEREDESLLSQIRLTVTDTTDAIVHATDQLCDDPAVARAGAEHLSGIRTGAKSLANDVASLTRRHAFAPSDGSVVPLHEVVASIAENQPAADRFVYDLKVANATADPRHVRSILGTVIEASTHLGALRTLQTADEGPTVTMTVSGEAPILPKAAEDALESAGNRRPGDEVFDRMQAAVALARSMGGDIDVTSAFGAAYAVVRLPSAASVRRPTWEVA